MSRFFAFGCSFTYYCWPTWADLIGSQYDEYYNQAFYGRGNQYIMHSVYEADSLKTFTADDTIIVMLTGFTRTDTFINGQWTYRGSVYNPQNAEIYSEEWMKNFWSLEQGMLNLWMAVKAIKALLDLRGCKYKILNAFDNSDVNLGQESFGSQDQFDSTFSDVFMEESRELLSSRIAFQRFLDTYYKKKEYYYFEQEQFFDVHPTVLMHAEFVKKYLSAYFNDRVQSLATDMHAQINNKNHDENWANPAYISLRGVKLGTAADPGLTRALQYRRSLET